MSQTNSQRAQAAYEQEVATIWRDWCAYLRAQRSLLDARAALAPVAFDHDDDSTRRVARAEQALALLPAERRALFDAVYAQRRTPTSLVSDPDQYDRQVLDALLGDAEGRGTQADAGWGQVPLGAPNNWQWFQVDIADLTGMPDEVAYTTSGGQARSKRQRALAAALGVMALLLLLWFTWPGEEPASAANQRAISVNGSRVQPWPVHTVRLDGGDAPQTLALKPVAGLPWPSQPAWLTTAIAPLRLCLPSATLNNLHTLTLTGSGETPLRHYRVQPGQAATPDLLIEACGGDTSAPRSASLITSDDPPAYAVGEAARLGEAELVVRGVRLTGPSDEPGLPADTLRLSILIDGPQLDWASFAPTLVTLAGAATQPAQIEVLPTGAELRYLLPLTSAQAPAILSLSMPGQPHTARWRLELPALPTRTALLHSTLRVSASSAEYHERGLQLRFSVRNQGSATLTLLADDIVVTQGDLRLPVQASGTGELLAGEERAVTLDLEPAPEHAFTIVIGAARFEVTP